MSKVIAFFVVIYVFLKNWLVSVHSLRLEPLLLMTPWVVLKKYYDSSLNYIIFEYRKYFVPFALGIGWFFPRSSFDLIFYILSDFTTKKIFTV
jgi:hypothetical protein